MQKKEKSLTYRKMDQTLILLLLKKNKWSAVLLVLLIIS